MKSIKYKTLLFGFCVFLFFVCAAIYITYPLIFHMTTAVNGELVIAWIMNWDIHAITHFIWPFFDANIFYPYHNTLAYSDLLLFSSIIALPFYFFVHEPMLPSNITFLSSLILLGFFTYLLVFSLTKNFFAAVLSGLLIIFSPVVLDKRYHLQILAIEWIPLSLLFFLKFIQKNKYRYFLFCLLFFLVQTYNSFMAGYFLIFSYTGILVWLFFFERKQFIRIATKKTILFFLLAVFLIIPITIPYFQVSWQFHFVRDIRETIHLALQPEDLLVTNDTSRMKPFLWFFDAKQYPSSAEVKPGFLGLVFTLLSLVSIVYTVWVFCYRKERKKNIFLFAFASIGLFGLILSLGPALHIGRHTVHTPFLIPLPYALAYYFLPGFQGIRDSSRFEMLYVLSFAVVTGIVLDSLLKKKHSMLKIALYTILFVGIIAEFHGPIPYETAFTFEDFPFVYSWIASHTPKSAVIAELPMYNWDNNPFGDNREVLREYFSTLHFRKLVSGGSGFSPPPWQQFAKYEFTNFPSAQSVAALKKYGATYLIVHTGEFDTLHAQGYTVGKIGVPSGQSVLTTLSQNSHVRFIIKEGKDYVYALY